MNRATIGLISTMLLLPLWGCANEKVWPTPRPEDYALRYTIICDMPNGEIKTHILEIDMLDAGEPILFDECPEDYIFIYYPESGRVTIKVAPPEALL